MSPEQWISGDFHHPTLSTKAERAAWAEGFRVACWARLDMPSCPADGPASTEGAFMLWQFVGAGTGVPQGIRGDA